MAQVATDAEATLNAELHLARREAGAVREELETRRRECAALRRQVDERQEDEAVAARVRAEHDEHEHEQQLGARADLTDGLKMAELDEQDTTVRRESATIAALRQQLAAAEQEGAEAREWLTAADGAAEAAAAERDAMAQRLRSLPLLAMRYDD